MMSNQTDWNYKTLNELLEADSFEVDFSSELKVNKELLESLQKDMITAADTISKLKSEKSTQKAKIKSLQKKNDELSEKIYYYKKYLSEEKTKTKQQEKTNNQLREDLNQLKTKYLRLSKATFDKDAWSNFLKAETNLKDQLLKENKPEKEDSLQYELNLNTNKLIRQIQSNQALHRSFKKRVGSTSHYKNLVKNSGFDKALLQITLFAQDILSTSQSTPASPQKPEPSFKFAQTLNKDEGQIIGALASHNFELARLNKQLFESVLSQPSSPKWSASARVSPKPTESTGSDETERPKHSRIASQSK